MKFLTVSISFAFSVSLPAAKTSAPDTSPDKSTLKDAPNILQFFFARKIKPAASADNVTIPQVQGCRISKVVPHNMAKRAFHNVLSDDRPKEMRMDRATSPTLSANQFAWIDAKTPSVVGKVVAERNPAKNPSARLPRKRATARYVRTDSNAAKIMGETFTMSNGDSPVIDMIPYKMSKYK